MEENREPKINYLCNGKMEGCRKTTCYRNIRNSKDVCRHTKDIRYAKNFHRPYPKTNYFEQEMDMRDELRQMSKVEIFNAFCIVVALIILIVFMLLMIFQ